MSDLMLLGILRMPADSIVGDCAGIMQFVSAARGAADRIEADAKLIAELRAALEAAAADKREMIDLLKQIPQTPEQMIDFIGSNFNSMEADGWTDDKFPPEPTGDLYNVKYSLTVHDLLSAFSCHGFEDAVTLSQRQEES
ncbi:hypothetical protein [Burkholderia multivorans]|uniref:hypothetical protein n=1 Tax=Burkholderia multivorans TaxID=87883 RepID=UPI0021592CA1|nr:hypothetical protein [Burkholderia multivorans]